MPPRPELLYVSPVIPHVTGNGLAMRSGMVLRLLAERYDVSLLAVPLHGPIGTGLPEACARSCVRTAVLPSDPAPTRSPFLASVDLAWPASSAAGPASVERPAFADVDFAVVHVYRLTTLPSALPYLARSGPAPAWHLDLDEVESHTRRRLARLYRSTGRDAMARFAELEAELCASLEREILARFDRVYVCSPAERAALPVAPGGATVRVLPNVLPIPDPLPERRVSDPFTFLFVGTLGFLPNEDAVRHFCLDVLPHLRHLAPRAFELVVVGAAAPETLRALGTIPEVRLVGAVPSVVPWYRDADAVIVPLRAGGGTRIKILEAIAHRRPVVSTTAGIDGLALRHEEEVLVADTPERFAEECARLMREPPLSARLVRRAFALFERAHTPAAAAAALDA